MKHYLFFIVTLIALVGQSQTTYTSPYTENLTNQQLEQINRTITIGDKFIVIKTDIDSITSDLQQLEIKEVTRTRDMFGFNITYNCSSYDGRYPSKIKFYIAEKIHEIHLIQPVIDGDGNERYRFLID